MKKFTIFSLLAIIFLSACKKNDDENNNPPNDQTAYLAEATIGPEGGTMSATEFELIVPAGAFSELTDLKLSKNDTEKPFEIAQITSLYTIEGLPEVFSKSLIISIKSGNVPIDDVFMAKGEDNFISSLDTVQTAYSLLPTEYVDGGYKSSLPAIISAEEKSTNTPEPFNAKFTVLTSYTTVEGAYFQIYAPTSQIQQAEGLQAMLNNAREKFADNPYPMDYSNRTEWPVNVTIRNLKSTVNGYYINSRWGDNYGYMEFNTTHMSDVDQLKVTAGHEFMHLAQSLYDPRSAFAQAVYAPDWHWVNEATAVWAEESVSNTPGYVSSIRTGHQMTPLDGAEKGAEAFPGAHGYGMSSMIKRIEQLYASVGWPPLGALYNHLHEGKKPIEAFSLILPDEFPTFYRTFLESLCLGTLYSDIFPAVLVGNATGSFNINGNADTVKIFSNSYPQLSGRLFKVSLNYPELDDNAYLQAMVSGGEQSYISIFKYKSAQIELIGGGQDIANLMNLKQIQNDGWQLMILVTNKNDEPPYILSSNFDLTLKLKDPDINLPPFLSFAFWVDAYTKWSNFDTIYYEPFGWTKWQWFPKGYYNGELYVSTWDTVDIDNWVWKGTVSIDIDFENQKINWMSVNDMMFTGTIKDTVSFTVVDIPMVIWDDNHKEFKIDAAGIEEHITHLFYKRTAYGNSFDLLDYNCNNNCRCEVVLDDDGGW